MHSPAATEPERKFNRQPFPITTTKRLEAATSKRTGLVMQHNKQAEMSP